MLPKPGVEGNWQLGPWWSFQNSAELSNCLKVASRRLQWRWGVGVLCYLSSCRTAHKIVKTNERQHGKGVGFGNGLMYWYPCCNRSTHERGALRANSLLSTVTAADPGSLHVTSWAAPASNVLKMNICPSWILLNKESCTE